ncbi:hypothetical protein [Zunongwangia atlantica]|uniref:Uncharacterized protein n=1 Tax=Zunongwangia atlantica 22II14-10F7 TaxID=1185767 RepID=A0A1Y1T3T3_9FLAO|nr:hypothetical protein [Zunongwangia atlantica]ORL45402.1 hypothetical protein IIF7_11288 [Zunongwangia atlantica 22II14-10F7]
MIKIVPILPHNYAIDFVSVGQKKYDLGDIQLTKKIKEKLLKYSELSWSNAWAKSKVMNIMLRKVQTKTKGKTVEIEIRVALKFKTTNEKKQQEIIEEITEFLQNEIIIN